MRKRKAFWGVTLACVLLLTSCGAQTSSAAPASQAPESTAQSESQHGNIFQNSDANVSEGRITVLTNVTEGDRLEELKKYAQEFDAKYPGTQTVEFESIDDYENQAKIRLSGSDYGDVLLIPNTVEVANLGEYFVPLGTYEDLSKQYYCVDDRAYDGLVYGIPVSVQFTGIFYNKTVFEEAGITQIPRTIDEFMDALKMIKEKTDAIPLYTAYADQWTLNQWEANTLTVAGDVNYPYVMQAHDRQNFLKGSPNYNLYRIMYEASAVGLIEDDPATATFDEAKRLMANGEVATYVCSSWAIGQFQEAAMDAGMSEDVIGYMPFPTPTADMKQLVRLGRDYVNGVSVHSKHQDIALAWVKFFAETDYATRLSSSVSPLVGSELPAIASDWYDLGVEFAACTPAQGENQGLLDKIDKESEVGLLEADFKQRIIDAAIGNRDETYDDIMNELNSSWVAAMDTLGVQ